jgi:twitching motility two-component system response regulator PilG
MPSERAAKLVQDGIAAARSGDNARARSLFFDAVGLDPDLESAWLWLAGLAGDPNEAIGYLERVLQLNPKHPKVPTWIEHQKARLAAARWYCPICQAQAKERFTTCPSCRAVLDLARPDAALTTEPPDADRVRTGAARLATVIREKPDYFNHYYLGMALLNLGQADEALAQFKAALKLRPGDDAFANQVKGLEIAMAAIAAPPARPEPPPVPRPAANQAPTPKSVMVVDDSPTIRKLVGLTMTKNGFKVVEAGDGEEALEQIRLEGVPDVVLVDVIMPGMDGLTLCKRIRQDPVTARVPVIILSAHDGFLDKVRGKMAGSDRYLTKPFEPAALVRAVREFCPQGAR